MESELRNIVSACERNNRKLDAILEVLKEIRTALCGPFAHPDGRCPTLIDGKPCRFIPGHPLPHAPVSP